MSMSKLITIGQLAKRTGTNVSAIRFYADESLIPFIRSSNGHRCFNKSVIRRVSFILIAQNLGYSLKEIADALASLPESRTPTKADWTRLSKRFAKNIEERIEQLETLKDSLNRCIGCGCLSLKSCGLYNPKDVAQDLGSGPRYLLGDKFSDLTPSRNEN